MKSSGGTQKTLPQFFLSILFGVSLVERFSETIESKQILFLETKMRGVIANFLQSKGYGFIDGEDRNSYFFHIKEIRNLNETLTPGLPVVFEESLTPKGFKARNIKLSSQDLKYEIPDSVLTSKGNEIKGWQIIERGVR